MWNCIYSKLPVKPHTLHRSPVSGFQSMSPATLNQISQGLGVSGLGFSLGSIPTSDGRLGCEHQSDVRYGRKLDFIGV